MLLNKSGSFCSDPWRHLSDEEVGGGADGPVTISFQRWKAERERCWYHHVPLGIRLPNDVAATAIGASVDRFGLIVLTFPRFIDGRAYSQAHLLRGRFGFKGELRAAGNVLRDQLLFMARCGFDTFEIDANRARAENWAQAFLEFDVFYQPAADHQIVPILWQRLRARRNAAD